MRAIDYICESYPVTYEQVTIPNNAVLNDTGNQLHDKLSNIAVEHRPKLIFLVKYSINKVYSGEWTPDTSSVEYNIGDKPRATYNNITLSGYYITKDRLITVTTAPILLLNELWAYTGNGQLYLLGHLVDDITSDVVSIYK
jgi:hypothetical protein